MWCKVYRDPGWPHIQDGQLCQVSGLGAAIASASFALLAVFSAVAAAIVLQKKNLVSILEQLTLQAGAGISAFVSLSLQ